MRTLTIVAVGLMVATPVDLFAHRLDEYLQAARLTLSRQQVTIEVDMTPGVKLAAETAALLDRNGDGTISQTEAGEYGQTVLKEVVIELDGRAIPMTLARVEVPSRDEIDEGLGTIRLRAVGDTRFVVPGRRLLHFRNDHRPQRSVYLANALVPEDASVRVVSQTRDARQQSVHIEYEVGPRWTAELLWMVLAAVVLSPLAYPLARRRASSRDA